MCASEDVTNVVSTYVWMSVSQQLVEDVAELPAEHRVAGERKPVDRRPESVATFLVMGAQDAGCRGPVKDHWAVTVQ